MNVRSVLLAATMLALPGGVAMAQPVDGLYVGGGVGYNWTQELKFKDTVNNSVKLGSDGGVVALGSAGYGFGNGLRVELEGAYRGNRFEARNGWHNGFGSDNYGLFVNGLYDFDLDLGPVYPYAGAGIGYQWTAVHGRTLQSTTNASTLNLKSGTDGSVAGQVILGAAFPVGVPGLSVTTEYRFLATFQDEKFKETTQFGTPGQAKLNDQYNHAFLVGLRYAFNTAPAPEAPPPPMAPAPAPVAAPAPAPSRTYLVFFDWDKADLTGRARQIIAEAAQNSTRVQLTQIEVSGHADSTGTASYNLTLSRKRADNVAAELVRLGVPSNEIVIQAFGDSKPLVPTGANVREPQNRRVEIVLK